MRTLTGIKKVDPFPIYDITVEEDHCFELDNGVIAHNSLYPKAIVSGGTGIMYSANTVFIISKSQEKDGTELAGWKFTINIEKSRYVKEKSKLPFTVMYEDGIQKWTAIFDIAMESGFITKPKVGWYNLVDPETGEVDEKNYRQADVVTNNAFFEKLVKNVDFKEFVERKFKLSATQKKSDDSHGEDDADVEMDMDTYE